MSLSLKQDAFNLLKYLHRDDVDRKDKGERARSFLSRRRQSKKGFKDFGLSPEEVKLIKRYEKYGDRTTGVHRLI